MPTFSKDVNVETWEEVEALARRVFDYVKSQEQDKIQTQTDLQDQKSEMSQKNKQDLDEMGLDEPEEDFDESDDEMESDDAGGEPGDADGDWAPRAGWPSVSDSRGPGIASSTSA